MIRRVASTAGVLAMGGLLVSALYWLFLLTPESNALTLATSTVLVVFMLALTAFTVNTAVRLAQGQPAFAGLRHALRGIAWFVGIAIPVVLLWLAIASADAWVAATSGQISAWFIARFGWSDVSWLLRSEAWLSAWLRWVVIPVTGVAVLASTLDGGIRGLSPGRWIGHAWHWRTMLFTTIAFAILVAAPWRAALWRPQGLPPTWIEPTLAALRLGLVFFLMVTGAATIVCVVARRPSSV